MVKRILILCGERNSGKTKTLRKLFGVSSRKQIASIRIDGKIVCIKYFGSPQELKDFCHVKKVIENIKERLTYAKRNFNNNFILVIPFTLIRKGNRTNEDCIVKPIKWLRTRYTTHIIYLRKINYADVIMERLARSEIKSTEDYIRQSNQLKEIIKSL